MDTAVAIWAILPRHCGGEDLFEPKRAVLALASKLGLYGALQKFDKDLFGFFALPSAKK
jgi:hypothetical protein